MIEGVLTFRVTGWNHVARLFDSVRRTVGDHNDNPRSLAPPRGAVDSIKRVQLGLRSISATRSDEATQLALDITGGGHERLGVVYHPLVSLLTVVTEGNDTKAHRGWRGDAVSVGSDALADEVAGRVEVRLLAASSVVNKDHVARGL